MGLFKKKKEDLPFIARVNLAELKKQREEEFEKSLETREVSLLAAADYTVRLPKIRLMYVSMEKFLSHDNTTKVGTTIDTSKVLFLPRCMTIEDACKVVSYISEKVEKECNLEPASPKSVAITTRLLEKIGFNSSDRYESGHFHTVSENKPLRKIYLSNDINGVTDLFTVGGNLKLFNKSDMNERYFEWFTAGVTKEEVTEIYKRFGGEFWLEEVIDKNTNDLISISEGWSIVKVGDDVSACCHTRGKIVIEDNKTK